MKLPCTLFLSLLTLWAWTFTPAPASAQDPFGPRLTATRWVLAHGRVDSIRPKGIWNPANAKADQVAGAAALIDLIAKQPNPRLLTLGLDATGNKPANPEHPSPLIAAGGKLSSGVTLVVAEVPAGATFGSWQALVTRFGAGNLYATVSIPEKGIVAGMELVTYQQLKDYSANSLFFEAPDFGNVVVRHGLSGGTTNVSAKIILAGNREQLFTRNFGWAQPLEMVLSELNQTCQKDGHYKISLRAQLPNSFENPVCIRWAAHWGGGTHMGQSVVFPIRPNGTLMQVADFAVVVPKEAKEMITIQAVATSGPFLLPMVAAPHPQNVGLQTFHSKGSTLEDTISVKLKKKETKPLNQTWTGVLSPSKTDGPRPGKYYKVYTVDVVEGMTYKVELSSGTGQTKDGKALPGFFDSYLIVKGHTGKVNVIAQNDDINWPQNCNARVTFTATESGAIQLFVTSYRDKETGPFTLHIESQ